MDPSEAFKAARAKWAGSSGDGPTTSGEGPSTSGEGPTKSGEGAGSSGAGGMAAAAVIEHNEVPPELRPNMSDNWEAVEVLTRIAVALERVADGLSALSAPKTSTDTGSAANNVMSESSYGLSLVKTTTAPVSKPVNAKVPLQNLDPMPSTSSQYFENGVLEMNDDSDTETDPAKRCGVCRGPCPKMFALDCGHYPYCANCIDLMTTKNIFAASYKFKCPCCSKLVNECLELDINPQ